MCSRIAAVASSKDHFVNETKLELPDERRSSGVEMPTSARSIIRASCELLNMETFNDGGFVNITSPDKNPHRNEHKKSIYEFKDIDSSSSDSDSESSYSESSKVFFSSHTGTNAAGVKEATKQLATESQHLPITRSQWTLSEQHLRARIRDLHFGAYPMIDDDTAESMQMARVISPLSIHSHAVDNVTDISADNETTTKEESRENRMLYHQFQWNVQFPVDSSYRSHTEATRLGSSPRASAATASPVSPLSPAVEDSREEIKEQRGRWKREKMKFEVPKKPSYLSQPWQGKVELWRHRLQE